MSLTKLILGDLHRAESCAVAAKLELSSLHPTVWQYFTTAELSFWQDWFSLFGSLTCRRSSHYAFELLLN